MHEIGAVIHQNESIRSLQETEKIAINFLINQNQ